MKRKPELKPLRQKLEAMQPGTYCIHRSWGFGKIVSYDDADGKLVIDFEGKAGHRMDPAFCVTTMDVLAPDHILARKQTESETIEKMITEKPVDLVIELLKQYPNEAATGVELESVLQDVVGEARFKRWWTAAKKALAKDPRIAAPAKKTECYSVRDEPVSVEDEILEDFRATQSARRRILLAEKLLATDSGKDGSHEELIPVLEAVASVVAESNQLTASERLHGAWVRDDLAKVLKREDPIEPAVETLVGDTHLLEDIASELPTTLHGRLLEVLKKAHPIEWKEITFNLLKTSQGKLTTDCVNFLIENASAKEVSSTFQRWQTEQNLRAPVLLWIVKNRNSRKYSAFLHDLIGPRLLNAIFFAIDYEALQTAGSRRIPLGEELSDDTDLIPDLLSTADPETARDLANNLMLNQGFEELTKKSLLARFIKQFPAVQTLVAGESEQASERLLVSRESHDARVKEYEKLVSKKIPENSRAIATAREHGDLKENSEFKMAKQDQAVLLSRKAQLEVEMAQAQVTDFSDATTDVVGVGSVVTVLDTKNNAEITYTILGAWDGDPDNHIISYKTPLGASLLSKRVGDEISLQIGDHQNVVTIKAIARYIDQSA
ncbi:MAG: GreA/GreB family elongation factor [Opitutaceae bacterium]